MKTADIHSNSENYDTLVDKINIEIKFAKREKDKLLCLIVGYGSSGGSHKIKNNTIMILDELRKANKIKDYILGSDIDIFNIKYQSFIGHENIPEMYKNKANSGIIIVHV